MSKIKVNSIEDLSGNNQVSVQSIKETTDKQTIFDWYDRGEVFTTFKELDENDFYKIKVPFSVNEYNDFALFNIYESEGKKKETFNKGEFVQSSITRDSFKIFIPFTDEIVGEINNGGELTLRTIEGDFITNFPTFSDTTANNNYTYHIFTDPNNSYVILNLKVGRNLHTFHYDIISEIANSMTNNNFFKYESSKIKQTINALYELNGNELVKYQKISYSSGSGFDFNTTPYTIFDKATLEASVFSNTFAGETTRPDYGFGEDIDVVSFINENVDYAIVADKLAGRTDFYSIFITDPFDNTATLTIAEIDTRASLLSYTNIDIQSVSGQVYNNFSIFNDGLPTIAKSKSFIVQDSDYSVIVGDLSMVVTQQIQTPVLFESNFNDGIETHTTDVFNNYASQRIEITDITPLLTGEKIQSFQTVLKWFKILGYNNFISRTEFALDNMAALAMSFGQNSLTLNLYSLDENSDPQTGTIQYNPVNKYATINFSEMEEVAAGVYQDYPDDIVIGQILDERGIETINVFDFYSFQNFGQTETYNFSNFYHSFLNRAAAPRLNDNFFLNVINRIDADVIKYIPFKNYQGFIFKPISDQKNINTYIKK